jgi:hypothetical protein
VPDQVQTPKVVDEQMIEQEIDELIVEQVEEQEKSQVQLHDVVMPNEELIE